MTTDQKSSIDPRLSVLNDLLGNYVDELLSELGVSLSQTGKVYVGPCPIHGGDRYNALNLYPDGDYSKGYWCCNTRSCHQNRYFATNFIGFSRGVLSRNELGWNCNDPDRNIYDFKKTTDFLCGIVGEPLHKMKVDSKLAQRQRFIAESYALCKSIDEKPTGPHRTRVRSGLNFPCKYYLDRGYSPEILDKFDVGMSKNPKETTKDRIVVPVYNNNMYMVGYTARSIFDQCPKCELYHSPERCPSTPEEEDLSTKWRHNNFKAHDYLYNFWYAEKEIKKMGSAILVEGPGDVWRLEQNGIYNAVAMFGKELSDNQQNLLSRTGVLSIIVLTDNDPAGLEGAKHIQQKYRRHFNFYFPKINENDVGDMNADAITERIKPLIEKLKEI